MAIRRQQNFLGQQRVDVSDLRAIESGVSADFDVLAGKMMSGRRPLVIRGFTINTTNAAGNAADQLQLSVASGLVMHFGASESGTIFVVDDNAAAEVLSATNTKVVGGFVASSVNYIGLDLIRSEDASTADLKQFLDANTNLEIPKTVPTARTINYKISISTQPFSITTNICPIAKVETNANNNILSITDSRNMMFRLGVGGDIPNRYSSFAWNDADRRENDQKFDPPTSSADPFFGGDKEISSLKQWMDVIMSRLWEVGSGEYWYSATSRDGVKLIFGQPVLSSTQDNFEWNAGTNTLSWSGLALAFENSKVYYNTIVAGSAILNADGQCLYVDVDRLATSALVPITGQLVNLSTPTIPGSRFILAWRVGGNIFVKDKAFEVGRAYPVATTTVLGITKLSRAATTPSAPIVLADSERNAANGVAGHDGSNVVQGTGLSRGTAFSAGAISVGGGTNDSSVNIAKSSTTTNINGDTKIKGDLDVVSAGAMTIGAATQTGLTIGRTGAPSNFNGDRVTITAQSSGLTLSSSGNLNADCSGTTNIGTSTSGTVNISRFGQNTAVAGTLNVASTVTSKTITASGTGTNPGGLFANGTASTGAIPQNAATLTNGNLSLVGVANPDGNIGFTNTLTPKNINKAWVTFSTTGSSGGVTIHDRFNISNVNVDVSGVIRVSFAAPMANEYYAASVISNAVGEVMSVNSSTTTANYMDIEGYNSISNALVDYYTSARRIRVIIAGTQ